MVGESRGVDAHDVIVKVNFCPKVAEDIGHSSGVAEVGYIVERSWRFAQKSSSHECKSRVFRSADAHTPTQRISATDEKSIHENPLSLSNFLSSAQKQQTAQKRWISSNCKPIAVPLLAVLRMASLGGIQSSACERCIQSPPKHPWVDARLPLLRAQVGPQGNTLRKLRSSLGNLPCF